MCGRLCGTTLQPLQSFGGSELVRTNPTTATYYLADRTNRGIIVINPTNMTYKTLMKPTTTGTSTKILNSIGTITGYKGADPTGGFIGAAIYATGPANQGTTRVGTVEEVNSGPGFMAVYENPGDPNDKRWMLVTDGACQINNNGGGYSNPAAGGSMRACSEPADPSVAGTLTLCRAPDQDRLLSAEPPVQHQAVRPQDQHMGSGIPHRWWMYG
jgi:hypothetical protein